MNVSHLKERVQGFIEDYNLSWAKPTQWKATAGVILEKVVRAQQKLKKIYQDHLGYVPAYPGPDTSL